MTDAALRQWARRAGLAVVLVALGVLGHNAWWVIGNSSQLRPVSPGVPAPEVTLPAVSARGQVTADMVRLADVRGQVVVMEFWATWCGPCKRSLPAVERVYQRHQDSGLQVLSVNIDDPEAARALMDRMGLSMPLYADHGAAADLYRVSTIPHLVVIDRQGMVRHVHRGFGGESRLDAQVRGLLER